MSGFVGKTVHLSESFLVKHIYKCFNGISVNVLNVYSYLFMHCFQIILSRTSKAENSSGFSFENFDYAFVESMNTSCVMGGIKFKSDSVQFSSNEIRENKFQHKRTQLNVKFEIYTCMPSLIALYYY